MKIYQPQAVETLEGKPIMGFVIPAAELPALEAQITRLSKGEHILAVREEGDKLRVALFLYNPNPPKGLIEGIQAAVEAVVEDKSSIQRYARLEGYEPASLSFGTPQPPEKA